MIQLGKNPKYQKTRKGVSWCGPSALAFLQDITFEAILLSKARAAALARVRHCAGNQARITAAREANNTWVSRLLKSLESLDG